MEFTFSIRKALKESWEIFKKHVWFFVSISAVTVVLNLLGGDRTPFILTLVLMVASFVWAVYLMKVSLAAVDAKEELLSWSKVQEMLPGYKQVLGFLGVSILGGLLTLGGFILLIIPGIWIAFRLGFSSLVFVDKNEGIRKSLRKSWDMTKGEVFWTVVLTAIVAGLLYIVGFVLLGIGILVTYPLAMMLMAKLYRSVLAYREGAHNTVVVQAQEIPAHTENTPEPHHESENSNS